MTVYIDNMQKKARVGRITANWSHLMADTHDELMEFASRLGLHASWVQHENMSREHFDVVEAKRQEAIKMGAVPITYGSEGGRLTLAKARGVPFDLEGFRNGTWELPPRGSELI